MTKTIGRKTVLASFALTAIAGGVIAGQNLLTTPNTAQAITPPDSCFAFNAGTGTITDYYNNEANNPANPACPKDVDIPSTIGGVAVVTIGGNAFAYAELASIAIPSSVTNIGDQAFISNNLAEITIPSSVTNIGLNAFRSNQLTSITVPSSVTSVGDRAFEYNQITTATFLGSVATFGVDIFRNNPLASITYNNTNYTPTAPIPEQCYAFSEGTITKYLQLDMNIIKNSGISCFERDIDIPSTIDGVAVTGIGNNAFQQYQITSVAIPNGQISIGDSAFNGNQLTSVTIPDSVTSIGNYAFASNRLTSVAIPDSVTSIGSGTFAGNQLASVSIPNSVTSISVSAFANNQLTAIVIPSSVTGIGSRAFYDNQLTSVTIPDSVTSIGSYAFSVNQIGSVTIPGGINGIGDFAFAHNQLTGVTLPNSLLSLGRSVFTDNQLASVSIPNSVTSIGDYAFSVNQLSSVTIPNSVTSIGSGAFSFNQLTSVNVPGTATTFGANILNGNPLISIIYAGTTYNLLPSTPEQCFSFSNGAITNYLYADMNLVKNSGIACLSREVDIPDTIGGVVVTAVAGPNSYTGAFESKQLISVTIPSSVTSIGGSAFSGNRFNSVNIPDSVTSIGEYAFYNNQLTTIDIPGGVTSIGKLAFYGNRLTSVFIPNSVISLDPLSFVLQNPWGGDMDDGINGAPDIYSSNPAEVQEAYDNIWYAQLYTEDPSNPHGLTGGSMSEWWWYSSDRNANGSDRDTYGGHLINPTRVDTGYISSTGAQLSAPLSTTGLKTDGTPLRSYLVTETAIPAPLDPYAITPEEQAVMDAGFAQYYKLGNQVTLTAPATLAGLPLLRPASPHSLQLTQPVNTVNFIYGTPLRTIDFATPVGSATNPTANSVPSSVTPLLAKSVFSVSDAKACSQIQSASLIDGSDFTAPQTGQDVLGGLSFTIDCTASGGQADVSFALGGTITDLTGVKVYKQDSTNTITDITDQVQLTNNQTPDGTRTTISYSVTDGADLDDDGTVNGTIVDPIYLTAPTGTSFSLLGASSSSSEALAATGVNIWLTTATALLMLTTSTVTAIQTTQRKQTQ